MVLPSGGTDLKSTGCSALCLELANFDDNQGYVIGHSAVPPRRDVIQNGLFHFRKCSRGRLADQLFESRNAEHVAATVEHLDEPIGVENQTVAGRKFDFFGRRRLRGLGEATEDASARLEQANGAVGHEKASRDFGSRFVLFGLSPCAREVLQLSRLLKVFEVYDNEEEALAS